MSRLKYEQTVIICFNENKLEYFEEKKCFNFGPTSFKLTVAGKRRKKCIQHFWQTVVTEFDKSTLSKLSRTLAHKKYF